MPAHQFQNGLSLFGAGISKAQMPPDQMGQTHFCHGYFRVSLLGIADDVQPVFLGQFLQRFRHALIALDIVRL